MARRQTGNTRTLYKTKPAEPAPKGSWGTDGLRVSLQHFRHTKKGVLDNQLNFQVPPLEQWGWTQETDHLEFETLSKGQFSRLAGRQLITFEIRTMVIDYQPTWAAWTRRRPHAPQPQKTAQLLKNLVQLGSPVMFVARSGWWEGNDLRLPVTIRSVAVEERAGEIDARYFDLQFSEWRSQELEDKGYSGEGGGAGGDKTPATVKIEDDGRCIEEGTGKVVAGKPGTLAKLATYYFGDPTIWRPIAAKNGMSGFPPNRDLSNLNKAGKANRKLDIPATNANNPSQPL